MSYNNTIKEALASKMITEEQGELWEKMRKWYGLAENATLADIQSADWDAFNDMD